MRLIARTLDRAIKKRRTAKTELARMKVADQWFERNAEVTLEEIKKTLEKEGN